MTTTTASTLPEKPMNRQFMNMSALRKYIVSKHTGDEVIDKWLDQKIPRYLCTTPTDLTTSYYYHGCAPQGSEYLGITFGGVDPAEQRDISRYRREGRFEPWMIACLEKGNLYKFKPTAGLSLNVGQIIDWFNHLKDEQPYMFLRLPLMTFEQADAGQQKWHAALANRRRQEQMDSTADGQELVHEFDGGYRMVRLTTKGALQAEGNAMGHCVGTYWRAVEAGTTRIFSLRDKNNQPHATMEVKGKTKHSISQVKGKANRPPARQYAVMINDFVKEHGPKWQWTQPSDMRELGAIFADNQFVYLEEVGSRIAVDWADEFIVYKSRPTYFQVKRADCGVIQGTAFEVPHKSDTTVIKWSLPDNAGESHFRLCEEVIRHIEADGTTLVGHNGKDQDAMYIARRCGMVWFKDQFLSRAAYNDAVLGLIEALKEPEMDTLELLNNFTGDFPRLRALLERFRINVDEIPGLSLLMRNGFNQTFYRVVGGDEPYYMMIYLTGDKMHSPYFIPQEYVSQVFARMRPQGTRIPISLFSSSVR